MEERLKEILCRQVELLAEDSEKCDKLAHYDTVAELSESMSKLCSAYQQFKMWQQN